MERVLIVKDNCVVRERVHRPLVLGAAKERPKTAILMMTGYVA